MNTVYITILLILLVGFPVAEAKIGKPSPAKSEFIYIETHPNSEKTVLLQSTKCNPSKNELTVKVFNTKSKVEDGTVNIINIYADSGRCKDTPLSSVWTKEIKIPKSDLYTHIYITILSKNVTVL